MSFVKVARDLQVRFLAASPTFSGAARSGSTRHGHVLPIGCGVENLYPSIRQTALEFFERRRIKWWKSPLSGDEVQAPGPTQNMVSSQVACVNFLLPLAEEPAALTAMLRSMDDDVVEVVAIEYDLRGGRTRSFVGGVGMGGTKRKP